MLINENKSIMRNRLFKSGPSQKHRFRYGLALLVFAPLISLVAGQLVSAPAYAAGPSQTADDNIARHCKTVNPKKLRAACTQDVLISIRNAATYKCNNKSTSGAAVACIISVGNGYIDDALKQKPKTAQDFKSKLNQVVSNTGVDTSKTAGSNAAAPNVCAAGACEDSAVECKQNNCDLIRKYVNPGINLLSLSFGVIAAGSLITGGIQYSASAGDAQKVTNAKKRIFNTLLAVLAYLFLYSFLQFLVPGGIFNR
jgi:uncharacterized membrane protein YraQ (UPF0718 family)